MSKSVSCFFSVFFIYLFRLEDERDHKVPMKRLESDEDANGVSDNGSWLQRMAWGESHSILQEVLYISYEQKLHRPLFWQGQTGCEESR